MAGNVYNNLKNIDKTNTVDLLCSHTKCTKTRYVDKKSGYILLRVDENDVCDPLTHEQISGADISSYDCVVISDYNKGTVSDEIIQQIVSQARLSFIDTKKLISPLWVHNVDFIKINGLEYNYNRNNGIVFDPKQLVLTLGEEGIQYDGKVYPAMKKEVVDTSGCGDTVISVLAYEYSKNQNIVSAIGKANYYAGIAASKRGVVSDIY
jgi:bifunctional ADP-heptose synthase (sugar kinase/adenylyltransferase)